MGPHGTPWGHMWPRGHVGPHGAAWGRVGPHVATWGNMGPHGAADLGGFGLVPTQGAVELDLGAAPGSGAFMPEALEPLVADLVAAVEEDEPEQTLDAMADLLAGVAEQLTGAMEEGYLEEAPVAAVLERSLRRLRLRGAG